MNRIVPYSIILIIATLFSQNALGFSCDGKIVSPGDTKADVQVKCGGPAWQESREEEVYEKGDDGPKRKATVVDEWTYNFGPQSFLRILEFRNGVLAEIRTGGYGYTDAEGQAGSCDEQKIKRGDTKLDVLARRGEPGLKEERKEEVFEKIDENTGRKVAVIYENWTYNLGPNRFMRILTFKNGILVDIKTGGYGN